MRKKTQGQQLFHSRQANHLPDPEKKHSYTVHSQTFTTSRASMGLGYLS